VAAVDSRDYPLVIFRGAPYVELSLSDARGLFLFDTGANGSAVDAGWVEREQIPFTPAGVVGVMGTTGAFSVPKARLSRLDLGTGFFLDPEFNLQDFSKFDAPSEGPQVGLLGSDFINRYRTTLDYDRRRLRLELPAEREPLDPTRWQPTALTYDDRLPTVSVRVGGLDIPCRLDSGAAYSDDRVLLDCNQATVRALKAAGHVFSERGSLFVVGASGPETLTLLGGSPARPLQLQLGPLTLNDVVLVVHPSGTLAALSYPRVLASASVLSRLKTLVIDPFDNLLWLPKPEPTPGPAPSAAGALVPGD
jgi:hypothetical protein